MHATWSLALSNYSYLACCGLRHVATAALAVVVCIALTVLAVDVGCSMHPMNVQYDVNVFGRCLDGTDSGDYEIKWDWRPWPPKKSQHGITGWANVVASTNIRKSCGVWGRFHLCAHNPCTAHWPRNQYGLTPPPIHLQPLEPPPPLPPPLEPPPPSPPGPAPPGAPLEAPPSVIPSEAAPAAEPERLCVRDRQQHAGSHPAPAQA